MNELGSGGMGVVHRAKDRAARRMVALKQLHSAKAGNDRATAEALFEREYHTLVRLKHPRIIEVFDYGINEQGPYYTMELLDGNDLHKLAPLPFREACRHLRDVASSLALIHAHRLVHRDVSPKNVRLTSDGRAKLIDFGALAGFGTAGEVVGTPPCMAPEACGRLGLDERTDLYALGATAYWALTGRHAYPARQVQGLPALWMHTPPAPSQVVDGIPPSLDALVMSLLALDPLARPANAAAVIDQLNAIAGLDADADDRMADCYLASGRLVGRDSERAWLEQRLALALRGNCTTVIIKGASGIGKTRLLHEVNVTAQLKGFVVLRADAQSTPGGFEVGASLAMQLLAACPEQARKAAAANAPLLAHLSKEVADGLGVAATAPLPEDPAERRARFQIALQTLFMEVAAQTPVLVTVDNVHCADDNSAALLATLSHGRSDVRLMLALTETTAVEPVAPIPLRVLRKHAGRIKLSPLELGQCEELVASLFGPVPNTGRLAKVLCDRSAGNPQRFVDLVRVLVKRGVVKYMDGGWVLPLEIAHEYLPVHAEDLTQERLACLGPRARDLCEALSIHVRPVPIELCLALFDERGHREVHAAVDELVAEQVLVVDGAKLAFCHVALRQSVLAQLGDERRRQLHRHAGEVLLRRPGASATQKIEAAQHLLSAGDEMAGADLMARVTHDLLRNEKPETVDGVVHCLATALSLYEKHGRSKYEIASLLLPLMSLAFFVDWRIPLKHGERAIRLALDITGLDLAQRLSRFLPDKVALALGLAVASIRFLPYQLRGLKFNPVAAIEALCNLAAVATGTLNIAFDLPALKRAAELLRPLRLFGEGHAASLMYDFGRAQYLMSIGREGESMDVLEKIQQAMLAPGVRKMLGESWETVYGAVLYSLAVLYPFGFGTRALATTDAMEALGHQVWAMAAEEVRMLYHARRGESEAVQRCRERVELFAVQGNTTWQADLAWPVILLDSYIRAGDSIAVRTVREQLSLRALEHSSLQVYADIAHASYLSLRGDHRGAIEAFEAIFDELARQDVALSWNPFRACIAYAVSLNALGEHPRAKEYLTVSIARAGAELDRILAHYLETRRQLALAEAGLGNHAEAAQALDALLAKYGGEDQPLLIGLLHQARAEVALLEGDSARFESHFTEMERLFRASRNPVLIAHIAKTARRSAKVGLLGDTIRARLAGNVPTGTQARDDSDLTFLEAARALPSVASPTDRAMLALRLLMERAEARAGFLYLRNDQALELAAASPPGRPPDALEQRLIRSVFSFWQQRRSLEGETAIIDEATVVAGELERGDIRLAMAGHDKPSKEWSTHVDQGHRLLVLTARQGDREAVVGGVILQQRPVSNIALADDLLGAVAAALYDATG